MSLVYFAAAPETGYFSNIIDRVYIIEIMLSHIRWQTSYKVARRHTVLYSFHFIFYGRHTSKRLTYN